MFFTEQKYCLSMANVANCVDLTGDLHGLFLCRDAPKNQSAEVGVLAKGIMPEGIAVQIPSKAFHNSNQCKKGGTYKLVTRFAITLDEIFDQELEPQISGNDNLSYCHFEKLNY